MSNPLFGKDTKKSLHDLAVALRRDREQLMVQLNLGKMEFRDEWQEVEKNGRPLSTRLMKLMMMRSNRSIKLDRR